MTKHCRLTDTAWRVFWIAASVAVAILIFHFSSQVASESNELSKGFLRKLLTLLGASPDLLTRRYNHYVRKAAHFSIYALFGFCLTGVFHYQRRVPAVPAAIAVAALYAMTDEFHQSLVPGRGPLVTDVLLDASGAALGALIMGLFLLLLRKKRKTE